MEMFALAVPFPNRLAVSREGKLLFHNCCEKNAQKGQVNSDMGSLMSPDINTFAL